MTEEHPQDRDDRFIERVLAIGTFLLACAVTVIVLLKDIPSKNEMVFGTILGFVFGNMVGPVFRKAFGGPDSATRKQQSDSTAALSGAIEKIAKPPVIVPLTTADAPVLGVQKALLAAGFDPGPLTGEMNDATMDAIRAFQAANNLEPDGIAGPATLTALKLNVNA